MNHKSRPLSLIPSLLLCLALPGLLVGGCPSGILPIGSLDSPANNAQVAGGLPVSGWALSVNDVTAVKIYRNPLSGEPTQWIANQNLVYVGDGIFVPGARPDVVAAFQYANPRYPHLNRAGWGMQILTNMLPGGGNGTFTIHAVAFDANGGVKDIGQKTIQVNNATAVKPFGAIDSPASGETATGTNYVNSGWALTPQPSFIPYDGSTIKVWVDSQQLPGHLTYSMSRPDVAALLPGYANSNYAGGQYVFSPNLYANGMHTIAWSVTDNNNHEEGIGSRYWFAGQANPNVAIASIAPASGGVGSTVTITGEGFGCTQGTSTVKFNGTPATISAANWSAGAIVAPVPTGATTGPITVTVNGTVATSQSFTVTGIPSPSIASISPVSGVVGSLVTITGSNFGSTQSGSTVTFNGTVATAVTSWTSTAVVANVPAGAGSGFVKVTVNSIEATSPQSFTVLPVLPNITNLSPLSGKMGVAVSIQGTGFGSTPGTVKFNQTPASLTNWTSTAITASVPAGATTGPVTITVNGSTAASPQSFTVLPLGNLQELQTCIDVSPLGGTCTLAKGTHDVASRINVNRSNVTIRGETGDRTETRLRRGATFTGEMMVVNVPPSDQSILIQNLTFCGESTLRLPGNGCPEPPTTPTTCGAWQTQIDYNRKNGLPDPPNTWLCSDLTISQAGMLPRPPNPFLYTGPYSVTISNSAFEGATGHAVVIYPGAPQEANDIYITGSAINGSEVTGLLVGVNGEDYGDHRKCHRDSFLEDPSVHTPRNIRIDGNNGASNGFRHNFTGALGINAARWFSLQNNVFDDNYRFPQGGNSHGGTFFFDQCTDTVRIYGNSLKGPTVPYQFTEGMELWGRNIDVGAGSEATKNTITEYSSAGITLNSASTPKIRTNEMTNIPSGPFAAGIVLYTRETEHPCLPSFRITQNVTISGNTSPAQIDGVVLPNKAYSSNVIRSVTINSSGTVLLEPFVTLTGDVAITPAPVLLQPRPEDLFPRALAVQPFWDEEAPNPGPIPDKCLATAGNSRQAFTFPVGDVSGADNIAAVEGTFTPTVVDSSDPALGPVNAAQACHFRFTPPGDLAACGFGGCGTLDLAESVPDYVWGPSSIVGTGGVTIENSVCRIYAGSDKSKVTNTGNVLTLTLDIEFLNSTKKYMYAITSNKNDGQSNGGTWRYWGWW